MKLEELEATERETLYERKPAHVVGATALSIRTSRGHFQYVCAPDGTVAQRRFGGGYHGPDAHLGAVDA